MCENIKPESFSYDELIDIIESNIKTLDEIIEVFVSGCNDKYLDDKFTDKLYLDVCSALDVILVMLGYAEHRFKSNEFAHAEILAYKKSMREKSKLVNDIYTSRVNSSVSNLKI